MPALNTVNVMRHRAINYSTFVDTMSVESMFLFAIIIAPVLAFMFLLHTKDPGALWLYHKVRRKGLNGWGVFEPFGLIVYIRGRREEPNRDGDPEEFHISMHDDVADIRRAKVRVARDDDKAFRKSFETPEEFAKKEPELFAEMMAPSPTYSPVVSPPQTVPQTPERIASPTAALLSEAAHILEMHTRVPSPIPLPPPSITHHERDRRERAHRYAPGTYAPRDVPLAVLLPHVPPAPMYAPNTVHASLEAVDATFTEQVRALEPPITTTYAQHTEPQQVHIEDYIEEIAPELPDEPVQTQPPIAQEVFAEILREYTKDDDVFDNATIEEEGFTTHVTRAWRSVWDTDNNQRLLDVITLTTPVPEKANMFTLHAHISTIAERYANAPDLMYNRQLRVEVTYASGKRDVYRTMQQWIATFITWIEEYEENTPRPTEVILELCNEEDYTKLRSLSYRVRASHGIPSIIGDRLVRMDLVRTNGTCATAAYFMWSALNAGLFNRWRTIRDLREAYGLFKKKCKQRGLSMQWNTGDLRQLDPDATLVQHLDEHELHTLTPDAFDAHTCHIYITKGMHASLLYPLERLPDIWCTYVLNASKRTVDRRISPKPLKKGEYTHINTLRVVSRIARSGTHVPSELQCVYMNTLYTFRGDGCLDAFMQWIIEKNTYIEIWTKDITYDGAFLSGTALRYCNRDLMHPVDPLSNKRGLIQCKYHLRNAHVFRLRDMHSHLPQPLDALTQTFSPNTPTGVDECIALRDVLIGYQREVLERHGVNALRYTTLPAYAKASLLNSIGTQLHTLSPNVDEWIRQGYKGGHTHVYAPGRHKGKMYMLDVNSMFPWTMTQPIPHGMPKHIQECSATEEWLMRHRGFYDIHILHRPQSTHRLFWDDAEVQRAVETDTLIQALQDGYRMEILEGYMFKYDTYAREWVERMYTDKEKGIGARREIAKLTLNAAYGALGTKWKERQQYVTYGSKYAQAVQNNSMLGTSAGEIREGIWCGTETTDAIIDDINVAVSSCIASRARLRLYRECVAVEASGAEVLYVDTDCMLIKGAYKGYTHPTMIGALKVVDEITECVLLRNKTYMYTRTDGTTKACTLGLKLEGEEKVSLITEMARGEEKHVEQTRLYRPKYKMFTSTPIYQRVLRHTMSAMLQ
jgi:hypothetical protein